MADNTTNSLVDSSSCLLVVPLFAGELPLLNGQACVPAFSIQVIFLEDNFGVTNLRVWDANNDDAAGCIV